ncbi:MAG: ABC transporter ATP-binding protein [Agathobacter sp.]|nr:ABC transporter ATP-binding protein [Agathobacter sp.]
MEQIQEEIPSDALIYCDGLVKIYMSDNLKVMALQGLDLTIKRGEIVAIIGKSGSGKSTLLNMIGGLETPTAGRLCVDGRNLSSLKEKDMVQYRKSKVGFVWQKSVRNLFPYMTAVENVETPMCFVKGNDSRKARRAKALELLEEVGVKDHADKFPDQLSGGEQQRVAIAVALANSPSVLLADEPTGAVDTQTSDMIFRLFQKLNRDLGLTILIVTHDVALSQKVSRVVMISDGKISTEKIRKESDSNDMTERFSFRETHEEYSVLDKARRVQLSEEMLEQAGIHSNKVKIEMIGDKIVITKPISVETLQ